MSAIDHRPEDMTATVEAGVTLSALQEELARHRQWLPIDPANPGRLSLRRLIDADLSGPRRFGHGTIRDHLIGITVALADGSVIHSGGKVVKNVAGYDLAKLFIGGRGNLCLVMEATFRLRPLPETERFVCAHCPTLEQADRLVEAVLQSETTPIVLDLHQLAASDSLGVVLGFSGSREEVEWQLARAVELGFNESASLDYDATFWAGPETVQRLSVLPSLIVSAIRGLNGIPFVARAGNGIIYHRGTATPAREELPLELMRRIKTAFDPKHLLPNFPGL